MTIWQLKVVGGRAKPLKLGDDPLTIGRHPDNRLRLTDERASRHHCVIERQNGHYVLKDLGSRNGTKLNGVAVTGENPLKAGDRIEIGAVAMIVEQREAVAAGDADDPRAKGRKGEAATARGGPWVQEIEGILQAFAGQIQHPDEQLQILDANGRASSAIMNDSDGPRALRLLLRCANRTAGTDIHIEPKGDCVNVRMRVDGQMVYICELTPQAGSLCMGMVKAACQMGVAGTEAIQEGHFSCRFPDRRVEYRVSFTPSVYGQKLVIRVLDQRGVPTSLSDLNLAPYMHERIRQVCTQDSGLLLVCGPTGSGKTTTLYNGLREIDRDARNVITIEDPVEYQLEGVTQIPIDEKRGNTFHSLLRSVLRQDPDVILLGEIRDEDTARTAMQAAMTGHLVFSTVHSKDTIAAVFRLLDLKVEPYLVANSLNLVLAQRLVRKLCPHCKQEVAVTPAQATRMGKYLGGKTKIFSATGCRRCLKTGYHGRIALFELLDVNDDLRDVILNQPTIQAMKKIIEGGLFTTLAQSGWRLVAEGVTSLDEVDRIAVQS